VDRREGETVIRWGAHIVAAVVLSSAVGSTVACTLDFDRYQPVDAAAEVSTDDASADIRSTPEASSDAARADAGSPDAAPVVDSGPCTPPAGCFQQATSCGAICGQDFQKCTRTCEAGQGCTQTCTSSEQSCLGKCAASCIACTQDAGCTSSSGCLNATHP
jgi:hypothetical protein